MGSAPCQPPLTDVSGAVAATARRLVVLAFDVDPRPPEPPAELLHGRLNAGQDANSDEVDDHGLGHAANVSALLRRLPLDLCAFLLEHLHKEGNQRRVALIGDTGLGHSRGDYPPDTGRYAPSDPRTPPASRPRLRGTVDHPQRGLPDAAGAERDGEITYIAAVSAYIHAMTSHVSVSALSQFLTDPRWMPVPNGRGRHDVRVVFSVESIDPRR